MEYYFVIKCTGRGTKEGRSCVVSKNGRNFRVVGNIPELHHGMGIGLELNGDNFVTEYSLKMTENNRRCLEKAGVNPDEYAEILARHTQLKKDGFGWNVAAQSMEQIYSTLPFEKADKVHKEIINKREEETRMSAIQKEITRNARLRNQIAYTLEEFMAYFNGVEDEGAYERIAQAVKLMCTERENYDIESGIILDREMRCKESYVFDNIRKRIENEYELLTRDEIAKFMKSLKKDELAEEQKNTLWSLLDSRPCIITGGAGTGKTTVIKTLISCYAKFYGKSQILLIAPTGKAARRLAEKTNLTSQTIHAALRKIPDDDYVYYCEDKPLPYRLVIVDESSMIDMELMYDLLSAVEPSSKIIFVGDSNQLEPVGYGEPFFDFQKEDENGKPFIEVFTLNENHRQSEDTDILKAAEDALAGKPLVAGRGVKIQEIDFYDIPKIAMTTNRKTQILSPYNALNRAVNDKLRKGEDSFNIGDKVIMVKNTKQYSNGDIGYVEKFDEDENMYVQINGKSIRLTEAKIKDVRLAYSITIHKMQGSEVSRVILFIPKNGDNGFVSEKMLYTAITRAKDSIEIYYYNY